MRVFSILCIVTLLHWQNNVLGVAYLEGNDVVYNGSTLLKYYNFDDKSVAIDVCTLIYYDTKDDSPHTVSLTKQRKQLDNFSKRINPLNRGFCGFTITNYTKQDPIKYNLSAEYTADGTKHEINQQFVLEFKDPIRWENEKHNVSIGSEFRLACGGLYLSKCFVVTPDQDKKYMVIEYEYLIRSIQPNHIGVWICSCIDHDSVLIEREIELIALSPLEVIEWYTTDGGYAQIGCQILNSDQKPPHHCAFKRPDGKRLYVSKNGAANERYTTLGMNLTSFKCQLEVKLPLTQEEIGSWECSIQETGRYIHTGQAPAFPKTLKKAVEVNKKNEIACAVPYSSDSCSIIDPQGNTHSGGSIFKDFYLGNCRITTNITEDKFGTWKCIYSNPNDPYDEIINVEVVGKYNLQASFVEIEVEEEDSLEILCKSESALFSCFFIAPNGASYHTSSRKSDESKHFEYVGRGLKYGDCGIKFKESKMEFDGKWLCGGKLGTVFNNFIKTSNTTVYVYKKGVVSNSRAIMSPVSVIFVIALGIILAIIYKLTAKRKIRHIKVNQLDNDSKIDEEM